MTPSLKRAFHFVILTGLLATTPELRFARAQSTPPEAAPLASSTSGPVSGAVVAPSPRRSVSNWLGVSYAIFFAGPGLVSQETSPNHIGRPTDDGLSTTNNISLRFKIWEKWALDLQTRTRLILNDGRPSDRRPDAFQAVRWESPSIGISGELLKGDDWVVKGAINSDFPYFMGEPFAGFTSKSRTTIATPGMFASARWNPSGSRWSVFSLLSPRWYIYDDALAVEPQFTRSGRLAQNKREFDLSFRPAVSYFMSEKFELSLGSQVSYNKQVGSSWNPLQVSLVSNGSGPEWRLDPVPLQVGGTYNVSKEMRIFTYVQGYPIEAQRFDARPTVNRTMAFNDTLSLGVDLTGTLF